jgi:DNA polymerase I
MVERRDELEKQLVAKFGTWEVVEERTLIPKRDNKTKGYMTGVPVVIQKTKVVQFNPGSRDHCAKVLMEAGWEPEVFTPSGKPKLDEAVLETIKVPEAQLLIDYLIVQKRLGQLADGDKGWLKLVRNGRIHASYNIGGTVTFRASHGNPNIAQVPKVQATKEGILRGVDGGWGYECRELFTVPKGWRLVGADMAGCQLRALGDYAAQYDGGKYAEIVATGDVHTYHLEACAPHVKTRDAMKTTIYAYCFGAMDGKLGKINGGSKALGTKIRQRLLSKIPALGEVDKRLKLQSAKGYIRGLDGRRIYVKQDRLALNYALQSWEAIVCKTWMVLFFNNMERRGYRFGWDGDFVIVGWVHDELQVAVRQGLETEVGDMLVRLAKRVQEFYKLKVALDSSYKVGNNWAETH